MEETNVKTMPYSRQAEEAVIGSVLIDGEIFPRLPISPDGEEFHIHKLRFVWQTAADLYRRHEPVDYLTVLEHLANRKATVSEFDSLLNEIGGPAYIMSLINQTPTSINAEYYARLVLEHYDRRQLIQNLTAALTDAFDTEKEIPDIVTTAMQRMSNAIRVEGGLHHWKEDIGRVVDYVDQRMKDPSDIWGIPTGIPDIDKMTGGLQRGEFWVLAGSPGVGKSIFFRQLLRQVAMALGYPMEDRYKRPDHHNVAAFSLEMDDEYVTMRDLSALSDIPTRLLNTGKIDGGQLAQFVNVVGQAERMSIYQTSRAKWTPAEMRAAIGELSAKLAAKGETLDLVGIDYLFLMVPGLKGDEKPHEKAEILSTEMKGWAREFHVPVLAINSMTKEGFDDTKPSMGDMRGGGQLFHNADVLVYLTRYVPPEQGPVFHDDLAKRLRTFWFTKGRSMEEVGGRFDLVKGEGSPWLVDAFTDPVYAQVTESYWRSRQKLADERDTIIEKYTADDAVPGL